MAKEAVKMSMDKGKAIDAALSQIEKKFGKGSIMRLGERVTEDVNASAAHTTATDAHLEALLAAWPQLSEEMRAAVRAMVEAVVGVQ